MQMKVSNINMCAKMMFLGTSLWLLSLLSAIQTFAQNKNMTIEKRIPAKGLAIMENGFELHPYEFTRHAVGDKDIEVKYCMLPSVIATCMRPQKTGIKDISLLCQDTRQSARW